MWKVDSLNYDFNGLYLIGQIHNEGGHFSRFFKSVKVYGNVGNWFNLKTGKKLSSGKQALLNLEVFKKYEKAELGDSAWSSEKAVENIKKYGLGIRE